MAVMAFQVRYGLGLLGMFGSSHGLNELGLSGWISDRLGKGSSSADPFAFPDQSLMLD